MEYKHIPVLLSEVIGFLKPEKGDKFIDCTLGGGGYSLELARVADDSGLVIGVDQDPMSIAEVRRKIKNQNIKNLNLVHDNFKNLSSIIQEIFQGQVAEFDGIVFDLGLSSAQLEDRDRGFSFQLDEAPLVMEFAGKPDGESATAKIINEYSQNELERLIREYGEEKHAHAIARNIVKAREDGPILTVGKLAEIISRSIPPKYKYRSKLNPSTKTFQALRIATNDELESLISVLPQAMGLLKKGGRMAVISYHSLEDRIVKNFFKHESRGCICPPAFPVCRCVHRPSLEIITKKPVTPSENEQRANPRSRSAKLRVAEKII